MTSIAVDPALIKTVRKARKIGRPKLARLIGMTERQVAKLETSGALLSDAGVQRLSDALQVPVPALLGDLPLIADDLKPVAETQCTKGCCG